MAVHHLVGNAARDIGKGEQPSLFGDARLKDNLQQQVAKLVTNIVCIALLNRIGHLIGFLDGVGRDAGEVLFDIPGATCFRVAKPAHDVDDPVKLMPNASICCGWQFGMRGKSHDGTVLGGGLAR